jgi:hypothetical protein
MGMDADIIGIGPYSDSIAHLLSYSPAFYMDTKEGAEIITTVYLAETTASSHALAQAVGVEPWDFNTHKIDVVNIHTVELVEFLSHSSMYMEEDAGRIFELAKKGFTFFYRPNG